MNSQTEPPRTGRSIGLVASGAVVGQAVAAGGILVLARLYSPGEFGEFAVMVAIAAVVGVCCAGRLDAAIPLPEAAAAAADLTLISLRIAGLFTAVGGTGWLVGVLLNAPSLAATLAAGVAAGGAMCLVQTLNQWAIRRHEFKRIALRNATLPIGIVLLQVVCRFLIGPRWGLDLGYFLSYVVTAVFLALGSDLPAQLSQRARTALTGYGSFPKHLAPAGALNSLGMQMPVLLVSGCFGSAVAGWYGMTQRAVAMPLALIGTATGQVFLSQAAVAARENREKLRRLFGQVSRRLGVVALLVAVGVPMFAPLVFPWLLGSQWQEAGIYAAILAPGLALQLLAVPLSQTLVVLGRTRTQFLWDLGRVVLLGGLWLLAATGLRPRGAIVGIGLITVIAYGALWALNASSVRRAASS